MAPRNNYADSVDTMVEQWARERPDLDLSPLAIFGRVAQLWQTVSRSFDDWLAPHGLNRGEFDVLTALRRSGNPYVLTPSTLSKTLLMSKTGMTSRIDRLESAGLVERSLDPTDRRSFQVALTVRGHSVVDATIAEEADHLARLVEPLSTRQRRDLESSLRILLRSSERSWE